jgi:hypothetical protein
MQRIALRVTVIDLEHVAGEADHASQRARRILAVLELECEDEGVIAAETVVYLEPPQSQSPTPVFPEDQGGNGR